MDSKTYRAELKAAVDNNDFGEFNKKYLEFLKQFDSFQQAYSPSPTDLPVTNAIFGERAFFLKQTNDVQAEKLLSKSRAASKVLGKMSIEERLEFLKVLEAKLANHQEEFMITITADTGKPIDLSKGEMGKGNEWFQYAQDNAKEQLGDKVDGPRTRVAKPLGAAQVIGAYNYPYALAIGGIVGGLTSGNGVVVSAPLKAPNWVFPFKQAADEAVQEFAAKAKADGKAWADDFAKAGDGVIQLSIGVNRNLTATADVVHFVGGDVTGELIRKSRGQKRTVLEMGGSNVIAVMASAAETPAAAEKVANAVFAGFGPATGQRCTAPRMLFVQEGAEAVTAKLKEICDTGPTPGKDIGNPFQEGIKMGPLVDSGAHQRMMEAINIAHELGAEVHGQLHVGNNAVPQASNNHSYWVNPIVIDWSNVDMADPAKVERMKKCMKDEIFGPLLHIVHPVKTLEEAIAKTNTLDNHGLAGAIFTNNEADVIAYQDGTKITSLAINGAPKDQSPHGEHGHPGLDKIGGDNHFNLYSDRFVRTQIGAFTTTTGGTAAVGR